MRAPFALVLVVALASTACRRNAPEAAPTVDAAADAAPVDVPFAVVAEGPLGLRATKTIDGRILVTAGPMLYEAKPNGVLEPFVAPAELAKLIPDDDTVVGYSTTYEVREAVGALGATLFLHVYSHTGSEDFSLSGGRLARLDSIWTPTFAYRGHRLTWDAGTGAFSWADGAGLPLPVLPPAVDPSGLSVREGPNGSLVALSNDPDRHRLIVWPANGGDVVDVPFPQDQWTCELVPSFAGRIVVTCGKKFMTLVDGRLVATKFGETAYPESRASQDASGATYIVAGDRLVRCLESGECTSREMPKSAGRPWASYDLWGSEFVKPGTAGETWQGLHIGSSSGDSRSGDVIQILARGVDDIWLVVQDGSRSRILHTSTPPAKPMMLPSAADARIALRNERPPARWTGPCDQVYVRLGNDGEAFAKRRDEINTALGTKEIGGNTEEFVWWLVQGTLGDQPGAGIVLARRSPTHKLASMEKAIHALAKAFATGPANEPPAYCTLPVLERMLLSSN